MCAARYRIILNQIMINISRDNLSIVVFEMIKTSAENLIVDRLSLLKLRLKITGIYPNAFAEIFDNEHCFATMYFIYCSLTGICYQLTRVIKY